MKIEYTVGQYVEALNNLHEWQAAIIVELAQYLGRPGYYILWRPLPTEQWCSQGGWMMEQCIRPRPLARGGKP